MARFAGQREDGKYPYVVTTRVRGQETRSLVWEFDVREAKAHQITGPHITRKVRRASQADVLELEGDDDA
jgi:hypothetical protein